MIKRCLFYVNREFRGDIRGFELGPVQAAVVVVSLKYIVCVKR